MGHWCRTQWSHIANMAELGLKKKEIDAIEFAFDVYDFKGDGKVDAFYAGDLIRACNLNPTLKTITEIGGGQAKGTKFLGKADIFPMYKACKDSKDQGGFHDFVEILKLYCTVPYSTIQYCTVQNSNGTFTFLPRKVPGVTLPPKLPFAANFCGCLVVLNVRSSQRIYCLQSVIVTGCDSNTRSHSNTHFVITAILVISNKPAIECYLLCPP